MSVSSECQEDTDCAAGQRCVAGGGVFVQDGVCVEEGFEADTGELDSGPGELDSGPGELDSGPGELDSGPGEPDVADAGELDAGPGEPDVADAGELDAGPGEPDAADAGELDAGPGEPDASDAGGADADADPADGGSEDVGPTCPAGQELCNGDCVELSDNDDHCGGCNIACEDEPNAEVYCSDFDCILECHQGFDECSGDCVDLSSDDANCGNCSFSCAAGEYCVDSQCEELLCDPAATPFGGGSGTTADPYAICTADHFSQIGATDLSAHYQLYTNISLASLSSAAMVGDSDNPFEGHFDGDQYEIEGLSLSAASDDEIGLFAVLAVGAVVENLSLLGVEVHGDRYVGGLAGRNEGTIRNVAVTGTVEGEGEYVGGVVGQNKGAIENTAFLSGEVTSQQRRVGGLVGRNEEQGVIERSWVLAYVEGDMWAGGFVGWNDGLIIDSYALGEMENSGGFVGVQGGITTNCYAAVDDISSSSSASFAAAVTSGDYEFNGCYYELDGFNPSCVGLSQQEFADPENFEGWDFVDVWEIGTAADGQTRPVLQWQ